MTVHSLYVFNRKGVCLYYTEWNRPLSTLADNPDEDRKLMFGLQFSLKQLVQKMSPAPDPTGVKRVTSSAYALHTFESATGYKFVMTTSTEVSDMVPALWTVYRDIFLRYVVMNPLYELGTPITCPRFVSELNALVSRLPGFAPAVRSPVRA